MLICVDSKSNTEVSNEIYASLICLIAFDMRLMCSMRFLKICYTFLLYFGDAAPRQAAGGPRRAEGAANKKYIQNSNPD